jgi:hypothetical protein
MPRARQYEDGERIQTQIRLPRVLHDRLRYQAESRMVSMNLLMERAIEAMMDGWEKEVPPPAPAKRRRTLKKAS